MSGSRADTLTRARSEDALTAASTLTLTKNDSTHTGAGSVDFSYSAADKSFDFLAPGETLAATYDVTVSDQHKVSSMQASLSPSPAPTTRRLPMPTTIPAMPSLSRAPSSRATAPLQATF